MATSELGALLHAGHQVAPAATRAMEGCRPPRVASGSHPSSSFSSRSSGEPTSREMAAGAAPGLRPGCLLQRAHREQGRSRHGDPDAGTRMRRLFVGNVDQDTCHSELDRLFYPYGSGGLLELLPGVFLDLPLLPGTMMISHHQMSPDKPPTSCCLAMDELLRHEDGQASPSSTAATG